MIDLKINMLFFFPVFRRLLFSILKIIISNAPMNTYFMKFERNGNAPKTKITNKVSITNSCIQELRSHESLLCKFKAKRRKQRKIM